MSFMSSNCATQELSGHFRRFGTDGTDPGRYYEEEREVGMLEDKILKAESNPRVNTSNNVRLQYRTKGALGSIGHEYSVSSDDAALLSQWSVFFGELVVA
ncbi:19612_t:CDS:2, partial [Rhizophagus irregularis]